MIFATVASVFFEQLAYTISVASGNITLRIVVNETLETNIIFDISITGIEGVRTSGIRVITSHINIL